METRVVSVFDNRGNRALVKERNVTLERLMRRDGIVKFALVERELGHWNAVLQIGRQRLVAQVFAQTLLERVEHIVNAVYGQTIVPGIKHNEYKCDRNKLEKNFWGLPQMQAELPLPVKIFTRVYGLVFLVLRI